MWGCRVVIGCVADSLFLHFMYTYAWGCEHVYYNISWPGFSMINFAVRSAIEGSIFPSSRALSLLLLYLACL